MSAIVPTGAAEALAPLNIERALALVRDSRDLRELAEVRDQAKLLAGLARTRDASLETQQAAGEVKLRAEWRMGKVLGEQQEAGERQRRGDAGRAAANQPNAASQPLVEPAKTLEDLGIKRNLAQKVQLVARQPEAKLDSYIAAARTHGTEITTAGLLNHASKRNPHAASRVNDGDPNKNNKFTPRWLVVELKEEFKLAWDFAGHELAPATEVFGRKRVWTAEDDCFTKPWTGKRGLFNPPWDELAKFMAWAFLKLASGECPLVVAPLPGNRGEQDWIHEFVEPFRPDRGGSGVEWRNVRGPKRNRIGYGTVEDPEGEREDNNPGMPTAVLVFQGPFVRSPRVPPRGTIDEVIAAQRFGDDQGLAHLWRQALRLARGEAAPPSSEAPDIVVTYEWCQGSTQDPVHAFASESPQTLSRCTKVQRGAMRMVNIRGAPPNVCPVCRFEVDAAVRAGKAIDGLTLRRKRAPAQDPQPAPPVPPGALLTLDQFRGELVDLGYSLSKRSGAAPAVAVRCTHRGCEEAFRVAFSKGTSMVVRAELKRLRAHSRSHAGKPMKKGKGNRRW